MTDTPAFWLALVAAVLSAASLVLHVVAPRTKTTVDDRVMAGIDTLLGIVRTQAPKPPPTGPFGPIAVLALVLLGLAAASSSACTPAQRTAAKTALVDCTASHGTAIGEAATSMRNACAPGGVTDWTCVELQAASTAAQIGGCAFLKILQGQPVALLAPAGPDPGLAAFEHYRGSYAGGATFRTAAGDR
jgi:hypothetical protein